MHSNEYQSICSDVVLINNSSNKYRQLTQTQSKHDFVFCKHTLYTVMWAFEHDRSNRPSDDKKHSFWFIILFNKCISIFANELFIYYVKDMRWHNVCILSHCPNADLHLHKLYIPDYYYVQYKVKTFHY